MLGISFGTSTISCAFAEEGNNCQPKIVVGPESSCVFFNRNNDAIFVGNQAEIWKFSSQGHAIYDFKRLIGQKYSHDTVMDWQKAVPNVPIRQIYGGKPVFEIVQNGETKIKGAEQIVAQILTKMRQQAEKNLHNDLARMSHQPILPMEDIHLENVVLTVPACFKMTQKHAIEEAAKMAGFEKIQLVEESFAAGLGFVHENPHFSGILLVFNFGAGFLDISILNVINDDFNLANFMENKRIEILGMAGDGQLGGLDIDEKIVEYFAEKVGQKFTMMDLMGNTKLMEKLRMECKKLKENIFTFNDAAFFEMNQLLMNEEELTMSVQELEEICAPICKKAIQILMCLLKDTEMDGDQLHKISKILLIGGTSRIPLIKRLLMENGFNEQQFCTNFDLGNAAKGAAIFGSKLGKMLSPNCGQLLNGLDILLPSHSECIVLFPPGKAFPTGFQTSSPAVSISCQTSEDGQSCIRLEFYEFGEFFAFVTVDGLPPESKAGTVKVDLEIGLTKNGLPHVECLQINYPTTSFNAFRVPQQMKHVLPLEFAHFHGCQFPLPSSSHSEMKKELIYEEEIEENIPPKKSKMEDAERECPFCLNEFGRHDDRIFCEPLHTKEKNPQKRHSICAQCVIQSATISVQDRALTYGGAGLPCMATECTNVLTLAQMRRILPKYVLEQFDELAMEYTIENVDKLERCTNCNFRMILESNSTEMRIFRCPECNYEICRKCKFQLNEHFGQSCEQLVEAERKRIQLEGERIRLLEEMQSHEEKMEKQRIEGHSELYYATMKKLLFKSIPFYDGPNHALSIPYHFANSLRTPFSAGSNTTKRLAKEIAEIHESLPVSTKSSIFVRACEERLDVMKVLIIGPAGTPYANGCFEFDVFFTANYPNEPMKINFETTGNKTVRFNPNLYDCGKVCLSILNTWTGSAAERWNASTSTLLQVLVSIQGLIFVEDPFYNEPGYANMRNTVEGEKESCEYNVNIRKQCVRWAMLQQIQNPPKAFADVIECHFWLKKEEICAQVDAWIEDFQSLVEAGKVSSFHSNLNDELKILYGKLKSKFSAMKCPPALQNAAVKEDNKDDD